MGGITPGDEGGGGGGGSTTARPDSWRLVVDGSDVDMAATRLYPIRWQPYLRDGVPWLELMIRGGALAALPDPYLNRSVEW